jgi:hypothetical protein
MKEAIFGTRGPVEHAAPRHNSVHKSGKAAYIDYALMPAGANVSRYRGDEVAFSPSGKYLWATQAFQKTPLSPDTSRSLDPTLTAVS